MTYTNPILYADYSDPDVIRVGEDFYMVASSFTYLPGVPVLHSRDLAHWEIINYAVQSLPFGKYSLPSHGSGTWAPSIRFRDGEFIILIPLVDEGIMVARSKDIRGTFRLNMLTSTKGWIDPCPVWDTDGRTYMVFAFAFSRSGKKHVLALIETDPGFTHTIGDYEIIFDGTNLAPTSEGPKAYYRDGWHYILFPAGGVATGWQCCIRSRSVHGPYEYRPVMKQGRTKVNGPHQGGWVKAPDGSEWFVHFQDVNELGRITHLEPLTMTTDGWPLIGVDIDGDGIGEPVEEYRLPVEGAPKYSVQTSDDFASSKLSLMWQWQANPDPANYWLDGKGLCLRFWKNQERPNLAWYAPNVLNCIPQDSSFTADAAVSLEAPSDGDFAGLGLMGHRYAFIGLGQKGGEKRIIVLKGKVSKITYEGEAEETELLSLPFEGDRAYLRIEVRMDKNYILSYSSDGTSYRRINHIFPLERATWTGAKVSLWAANRNNRESDGYARFHSFSMS